jgi:phosphopentomutase
VPILCFGPAVKPGSIGRRESFADIGASVLAHLGVRQAGKGASWL